MQGRSQGGLLEPSQRRLEARRDDIMGCLNARQRITHLSVHRRWVTGRGFHHARVDEQGSLMDPSVWKGRQAQVANPREDHRRVPDRFLQTIHSKHVPHEHQTQVIQLIGQQRLVPIFCSPFHNESFANFFR